MDPTQPAVDTPLPATTLPPPPWVARARTLAGQKVPHTEIVARLGVSLSQVKYWLYPAVREKARLRSKRQFAAGVRGRRTEYRDFKRLEARRHARDVWRREGGDLHRIYKRLECQ